MQRILLPLMHGELHLCKGQTWLSSAKPRSNLALERPCPERSSLTMRGMSRGAYSSMHSLRLPSRPALPASW